MAASLCILVASSLHLLADSLSVRQPTVASNHTESACNLGNVPFYVLNLDRRRDDKLYNMENAIGRDAPWMCKETCRVSAPDGRLWAMLKAHMNSRVIGGEVWRDIQSNQHLLTPGGAALMAGHGRIWEHILQDKAPFAVVMEDDLSAFHPDMKEFLCRVTQTPSLQEGWDFMIMQMGFMGIHASSETPRLIKDEHVHNTGMYIIKLDAARKALEATFPIAEHTKYVQLDDPGSAFWTKLRGGHTYPAIAEASHEYTDVQTTELKYGFTNSTGSRCLIRDCKPLKTSRMVIPELSAPAELPKGE